MDHTKILKRAWAILWQYRVLWIFGIILAITASSSSPANSSRYTFNRNDFNNGQFSTPPGEIGQQLEDLFKEFEGMPSWQLEEKIVGPIIAIVIGLGCVILLLVVIGAIARYISEAALIRLVDDYEVTGVKKTFREGFKLGWSRTAVRLFLINLTVAIPLIVAVVILGLIAAAPLMLWFSGNTVSGIFGTISTIGLGFLFIFLTIIVAVAGGMILHLIRRASALENLGVIDAFKRGFGLFRENLMPVVLMWLILLGVKLGSVLIIIPVFLVSLIVSGIFSGLLFLAVSGIAGLFVSGAVMWIIAGIVSAPIFIVLLAAPLTFVGGLLKVYESTVWTLSFRELTTVKTKEAIDVEPEAVGEAVVDTMSNPSELTDDTGLEDVVDSVDGEIIDLSE